jgi:hypothetical protein
MMTMVSEVLLRMTVEGPKEVYTDIVVPCPNCGEHYPPNAGQIVQCPKCFQLFLVSFKNVGIGLVKEQTMRMAMERCVKKPKTLMGI